MDVGTALREAREQRGLSVDELSRTTKISVANLRAIEGNEIDKLPADVFTRGFLKAYAREVGWDAEDAVQRYLGQFEPRPDEGIPAETDVRSLEHASGAHRETDVESTQRTGSGWLRFVALACAIGLAGYLAVSRSGILAPVSDLPLERAVSELSPATVPAPLETATSGSYADAPATGGQDAVVLELSALGPCWVSATTDGVSVAYRLMQAGERQTITARDEVVLRIGDPAAFSFLINNMPGRALGPPGKAVTLRITVQNYREFVSS